LVMHPHPWLYTSKAQGFRCVGRRLRVLYSFRVKRPLPRSRSIAPCAGPQRKRGAAEHNSS
jgi:hypothetical protein